MKCTCESIKDTNEDVGSGYFEAMRELAEVKFEAVILLKDTNSRISSKVFVARGKKTNSMFASCSLEYRFYVSLSPSVVQFPALFLCTFSILVFYLAEQ